MCGAMIRYALKCAQGHSFDSWFRSAAAFDELLDAGRVDCPTCGDSTVTKALMAPKVTTSETAQPEQPPLSSQEGMPMATMPAPLREAIDKLRSEVEKTSDYVGRNFAAEARAIHEGEKPERAIHGVANVDEARALLKDGIPILPLPFRDRRGTN